MRICCIYIVPKYKYKLKMFSVYQAFDQFKCKIMYLFLKFCQFESMFFISKFLILIKKLYKLGLRYFPASSNSWSIRLNIYLNKRCFSNFFLERDHQDRSKRNCFSLVIDSYLHVAFLHTIHNDSLQLVIVEKWNPFQELGD